ncbi:hypothetical protein [Nonomuraea zeae]|uniref:LppX_LprAFG lipoprotein n=1 Tax=Nonomuraea zeae TaxID=1642303 RepID=A0A5S4FMY2_9ACTN|nr:hypothetical protein [Nonomuraea zeae]TMR22015.1 hypothetical protein ETD85_50075 [Nonomuraea zeae]
MKKTIMTTLVVCGALLVGSVPAQAAAPKDPVRALKGKLTAGHGVRFTETSVISGGGKAKLQSRKGTFQFNAKGIAASDITTTAADSGRERTISVGKVSYTSGDIWEGRLEPGKSWMKTGNLPGGSGGFYGQVINPAEPKTLAALIKKGRLTGSAITGKITFKELAKVSPWFDASVPLRIHKDTKITYALTLTSAGLVSRVKSSYAAIGVLGKSDLAGKTMTIDSRFTGWGAKVSIKAPDPETVASGTD